jgi:CRISPR/Cas system-associated protein Cas7 (RAMP superfamily)
MTMTNQDARNVRANVSEDVHSEMIPPNQDFSETIAKGINVRLPNGKVLSPEAQIMFQKSTVSKDLGIPPLEEIHIKNLGMKYRWVNRIALGGSHYMQMKYRGYTNATLEDAEPLSVEVTKDATEIRFAELILMKIPIEKYIENERRKIKKAIMFQNRRAFLESRDGAQPSTDVMSDEELKEVSVAGTAFAHGGKYVKHYQPSQAELDAKMGEDPAIKGKKQGGV